MKNQRSIFIWDVQWCYDELKALLLKVSLTEYDKVYFVWDLINKWPKSFKILKYLYKNRDKFKSVLWNHEVNFLRWLDWQDIEDDSDFKILKSKIDKKNASYLIDYLKSLPLYMEKDDFILLHWWIIPWKKLKDHSIDEMTRVRDYEWKPWYDYYEWEKKVIYWHRAMDWIRIRENTIWLDSWCVYGKSLSCYILETWEVIQQPAFAIYDNIFDEKNNIRFLLRRLKFSRDSLISTLWDYFRNWKFNNKKKN